MKWMPQKGLSNLFLAVYQPADIFFQFLWVSGTSDSQWGGAAQLLARYRLNVVLRTFQ